MSSRTYYAFYNNETREIEFSSWSRSSVIYKYIENYLALYLEINPEYLAELNFKEISDAYKLEHEETVVEWMIENDGKILEGELSTQ